MARISISLLILPIPLSWWFCLPTHGEEADPAKTAFDAAMTKAKSRNHAEAAADLEKLLASSDKAHPLAAEIRFRLAEQYASLRQNKQAAETFLLLKDYPQSPLLLDAVFRAGDQWRDAGDLPRARESYQATLDQLAAAKGPRWWDCHWRIVDCLRRENRNPDALVYYEQILTFGPDPGGQQAIFRGRIDILRSQGQFDAALAEIDRASTAIGDQKSLARPPYTTPAEEYQRWRADVLRDAGKAEAALAEYQKLATSATLPLLKSYALFESAQVLRRLGQRPRAHETYLQSYDLGGDDPRFRERILIEILWNSWEDKRTDEGISAVQKMAFTGPPTALLGLNALERFCSDDRVKKLDAVPPLFRQVLKMADCPPDQKFPLQARLVDALRRAQDLDGACAELAILKQTFGADEKLQQQVQLNEADFHRLIGAKQRAAKLYEQHLAEVPAAPDPYALRYLAELLMDLGEDSRALEILKRGRATPNFREHGWFVERLAVLASALGDLEAAQSAWDEILTWPMPDRLKKEREERATKFKVVTDARQAAASFPKETEGGRSWPLGLGGQGELVLEAELAARWQASVVKAEDGREGVAPAGEAPAVIDFAVDVASPKPLAVRPRAEVVPAFFDPAPADVDALFQFDDRGLCALSASAKAPWEYPIVPLLPGKHRLRILLRSPSARLDKVILKLITDHVAGGDIRFTSPYGLAFKGEEAAFDVTLMNRLDVPVRYPAKFNVTDPYGKPVLSRAAEVAIPANGQWKDRMTMSLPATGPLSVVAELGTDHGLFSVSRSFGVIFKPEPGFRLNSPFLIDGRGDLAMLAMFGVKWVRWELGWGSMEPRKGVYTWDRMDAAVEEARKNHLYVLGLLSHAPHWAIAWGGRVPAHRRGDDSASPDHYKDYTEFAAKFAERYGDVVRAYCVWNEPWEGGSISGYGSCGYHFRQLMKALSNGVKSVDKNLLVVGNDSAPNIEDNLLCEKGFVEKYVDVGTTHTYSLPALMGQVYAPDLMRLHGKPCWDTESWWDPSIVVKTHAIGVAHGLSKLAPFHPDHLMGPQGVTRAGCVYSALIHFLEDTTFYREVNPHCLPWMFVFKGEKKNAAVLFGDLGNDQGNLWSQIQVNGEMVVPDPRNELTVYDTFGNPRPREPGRAVVPMSSEDFFMTTAGEVDAMCDALAKAKLSGFTPVEIAVPDFIRPLDQHPPLRVRIRNALNEPIAGTVSAEFASGIELEKAELPFAGLESGRQIELSFPIRKAEANAANLYPVRVTVKTDRGEARHEEGLSVACCVRGSPFIDGNVLEWPAFGAVPVHLRVRRTGIDYWSAAKYMWMEPPKFTQDESDFAQVATMFDSKYFYFMAKVKTQTNYVRKSMRSPDAFIMMPPPAEYAYKQMRWAGGGIQIAFDCVPNEDTFYPPDHPYYRRFAFRNVDYEYAIYPTTDGKPEVWRFRAPGVPWSTAYPFSPRAEFDQDIVDDARCGIVHDEAQGVWVFEVAIPLTELKELRPAVGKQVSFSFMIPGVGHWSEGRSTCKLNTLAFHPYWSSKYSVETEWGYIDKPEP